MFSNLQASGQASQDVTGGEVAVVVTNGYESDDRMSTPSLLMSDDGENR